MKSNKKAPLPPPKPLNEGLTKGNIKSPPTIDKSKIAPPPKPSVKEKK